MKKYMVVVGVAITIIGAAGWYYYRTKMREPVNAVKPAQVEQQTVPVVNQAVKPTVASSEISLSPLSICRALDKAIEFLNLSPDQIVPVNDEQRSFLNVDYATYRQHMKKDLFGPDELKAYVASDAETLNKVLRDNGFSIQLAPFPRSDSIGIVAIQNILVKWLEKAESKPVRSGRKEYAGFRLDECKMQVSFSGNNQDNPTIVIAEIATQTDDKVYCAVKVKIENDKTTADPFFESKSSTSDHDVMHTINTLRQEFKDTKKYSDVRRYDAIELPMISYQKQPSVKWLLGLRFHPTYGVAQALQEVIFKMNDFGARAKAAVAMELGEMAMLRSKEPLIVNQPFLLWIERPGMPLPIFAAYLEQKYWSDPGSIEE